ncbi:telomere repeat-binding factor 1-like [Actinidia eriantha]|uniref:telomere repeat-binding factor 1-like n=1 Tax=Actinidia eriantha TaxID=165200 RepID=UPI00258F67E8|nr:telomere repeat-binding factor 1-like [Actinidia eriantha]XP_057492317.1 telomere repeat-binding factor 1-like [Actinidia eriantha]
MGAPKQKWTSEEEAALKAGVTKYGAGKWSTILKDPEFSILLYSRSNVDLKDKWRNMNVAANGWGSRSRVRVASKSNQQIVKDDDKALSTVSQSDTDIVDAQPLAGSNGTSENASSKKPIPRLDNLILEAITNLKEPRGSSRAAIAIYIEERYLAPENLERLLAATLKLLTENGKLVKVIYFLHIFFIKRKCCPINWYELCNNICLADSMLTLVNVQICPTFIC